MAELVLFHHAQGLTPGVAAFAARLRAAGHTVHVPDLYDGRTFDAIEEGVAHAREVGFDELLERGRRAAEALPAELVYAGMSLGVMPAQALAQTRPGARGALLLFGAVPPSEFGPWPDGLPAQVHAMTDDPWFEEDRPAVDEIPGAELFLYPGAGHLFADESLPDYDREASELLLERVLAFLEG